MLDGSLRPGRRSGQWIGLTAVAAAMAVATVTVPPLIAPHRRAEQPPPTAAAETPNSLQSGAAKGSFVPISIQAEDPANRLTGGASTVACGTCRGGRRVRYLCAACTLVVLANLPVAGLRTISVFYEVDGDRAIKVRINGGPERVWSVTGPQWTTPQSFRFTAELPAGDVALAFYNDESPAPDLDEIVIS